MWRISLKSRSLCLCCAIAHFFSHPVAICIVAKPVGIQVGKEHGEAHAGHNNGMHWNPDLSSHQEQKSHQGFEIVVIMDISYYLVTNNVPSDSTLLNKSGDFLSERKVIPLEDFVVETGTACPFYFGCSLSYSRHTFSV